MKKQKKIVIGWILIVLQGFAILGRLLSGASFPSGVPGFFNALGFFSIGIVGVILLILGYRKKDGQ